MNSIRVIICCFLSIISQVIFCQVRLPRLISDGMVLQRDTKLKIWGWASADEKISIHFIGKKYRTTTGKNGEWEITISPMKAGGPYSMQIDGSNHITLKNILSGDVWICSGQSNMVLPMDRVKDRYTNVIAHAENTFIRQFIVPVTYTFRKPTEDVLSGSWEEANAQSVLHFTATGYFFARSLYERYHVPVGLINTSVGGSPVEAWLSEDALKAFPGYLATAGKYKDDNYIDSIKKHDNAVSNTWYNHIFLQDKGLQQEWKWFDTLYDANTWQTMSLPGYWDEQGLQGIHGVMWFRKEINIPSSMMGKPVRLLLGNVVDRDSVYLNGIFVGTTGYQYPPRKYDIPSGLLKEGKNIIVVRVINSSGRGGFYKGKPYQLWAGGQVINLQGEWQYKLGVASDSLPASTVFQYQPSGLFNGMIAPVLYFAIRGVIWYQGESNTAKAGDYRKLFPALISDWRQKWLHSGTKEIFPFLYVQLANFLEAKSQPSESNWAELREAQRKTLNVPNTAMAVTIDIGEWNDIHPLDKEDVGKRLALTAEKFAYADMHIIYSGPIYRSMKIEGNKIVISFSSTGKGLIAKGGTELKYFSIAGPGKNFIWAKARIEGNKVWVWSDEIDHPVAVRYAWADNPEGANLYNSEGLPASPFRTDE